MTDEDTIEGLNNLLINIFDIIQDIGTVQDIGFYFDRDKDTKFLEEELR